MRRGRGVTGVVELARKLGYTIEDNGAEQASLAVLLLTALFVLVSLSTLAVAAGSVTHTFFRAIAERRRELGVLRAVGASRADLWFLLLGEASIMGICGGVFGLGLARAFALLIDGLSRTMLPDFPSPDSYFLFSLPLCGFALGFSLLTCVLGAAWPAAPPRGCHQPLRSAVAASSPGGPRGLGAEPPQRTSSDRLNGSGPRVGCRRGWEEQHLRLKL